MISCNLAAPSAAGRHEGGGGFLPRLPTRERERERESEPANFVAMAWEEEAAVEEEYEYGEEMEGSGSEAEDVVVGQMPTVMVPKHINKRALKNKALSVSLDKKALKSVL